MKNLKRLKRAFFNRPTLQVAQELLGKILVFNGQMGMITETEAYFGFDDPASHAARGKTPRSAIMFGKAGFSYVYLIYGMYHCLNFVTEKEEFPAAVLIRGIKLLNLEEKEKLGPLLDGPGKLCRALGITKEHSGLDVITNNNFYVASLYSDVLPTISSNTSLKMLKNKEKTNIKTTAALKFKKTPRIGIKHGLDKLWRFVAIHD